MHFCSQTEKLLLCILDWHKVTMSIVRTANTAEKNHDTEEKKAWLRL